MRKRRLTSICMALLLTISIGLCATAANATETATTLMLDFSEQTVAADGTFTIAVKSERAIDGIQFQISFDRDKYTYQSAVVNSGSAETDIAKCVYTRTPTMVRFVNVHNTGTYAANTEIVKFTFKALAEAADVTKDFTVVTTYTKIGALDTSGQTVQNVPYSVRCLVKGIAVTSGTLEEALNADSGYTIDKETGEGAASYLKGIQAKSNTLEDVLAKFKDGSVTIYKSDGTTPLQAGELVGTGCIVKTSRGDEAVVIVKGDADGDGQVGARDLLKYYQHRNGTLMEYAVAFDFDDDNAIGARDLLAYYQYRNSNS